jgi:tetratricopeptide (TPR) repeat protein
VREAFDVFVSYRGVDRPWVIKYLLPILDARFRVFVDFRVRESALSTAKLLAKANLRSRWTLAVLSPAYSRSVFTDLEWDQALRDRSLLAVIARKCAVPSSVPRRSVVDWSTTEARTANVSRLVALLGSSPAAKTGKMHGRWGAQIDGAIEKHTELLRRAIRTRELTAGTRIMRDHLFVPLHYTYANYVDNADMLSRLLAISKSSRGRRCRIWVGPTIRPLTGTPVRCEGAERECPVAWLLTANGVTQRALGASARARGFFARAVHHYDRHGIDSGRILGRVNLADVLWEQGDIDGAVDALTVAQQFCIAKGHESLLAIIHQDLGLRLAFAGQWRESDKHLQRAAEFAGDDVHRRSIILAHTARRALLLARFLATKPGRASDVRKTGRIAHKAALAAQRLHGATRLDRHGVRALWLRAAARAVAGDATTALVDLEVALGRCRDISLAEFECDILLDLARCHVSLAGGAPGGKKADAEALSSATEALALTLRSGREVQRIEAAVVLAQVAAQAGDEQAAKREAERGLRRIARLSGRRFRFAVAEAELRGMVRRP